MKLFILLMAISLVGCSTLVSSQLPASRGTYTIQKIVEEIGDYHNLPQWFKNHFSYRKDTSKEYEWREIDQALSDGFGDCEEYAEIARECLRIMGYNDVFLLGVHNKYEGHVVCIFKTETDTHWQFFDFGVLKQGVEEFDKMPTLVSMQNQMGNRNISYKLANKFQQNIPPEEEIDYNIRKKTAYI